MEALYSSSSERGCSLRVAALQLCSENFNIRANLERAVPFLDAVSSSGAQLILLPEFYSSGYIAERRMWDTAERLEDGLTRLWVCSQAARLKAHIGLTFLEASGSDFYNTFILAGPDGKLVGTTRKHVPAALEAFLFRGDGGTPCPETHIITCPALGGLRVAVGICYENQLAYMLRIAAAADVLLMPHCAPRVEALPKSVIDAFDVVVRDVPTSYASALGIPVVMCNKPGPWSSTFLGCSLMTFKAGFCGMSQIVDSDGSVLVKPTAEQDRTLVATVHIPPREARGGGAAAAAAPPRWRKYTPLVNLPTVLKVIFSIDEAIGAAAYRLSGARAAKALSVSGGKVADSRLARSRSRTYYLGAVLAGGGAAALVLVMGARAADAVLSSRSSGAASSPSSSGVVIASA